MPTFHVDDDLVALVEKLARPKKFESFSDVLRRLLKSLSADASRQKVDELEQLLADSMAAAASGPRKAKSPNPAEWAASVPELKSRRGLSTWKAICDALKIETAGDSARRKLQNWVKSNRPAWPAVPGIE